MFESEHFNEKVLPIVVKMYLFSLLPWHSNGYWLDALGYKSQSQEPTNCTAPSMAKAIVMMIIVWAKCGI